MGADEESPRTLTLTLAGTFEQGARLVAEAGKRGLHYAVGYMKRNLNVAQRGTLAETLDSEAIHMIRTFETDDHKGAAAAFVEKRAPQFSGR